MEKEPEGPIPISVGLNKKKRYRNRMRPSKKRILYITFLFIAMAALVSVIVFILMKFIFLITNLAFYGDFSFLPVDPAANNLGIWVIFIPVIGGLAVGFMVLYGSKDIRGHG